MVEDSEDKFKENIEAQERKVYEKINPILKSYKDGKINKIELIQKLSDTFYELERD